MKRILLVIGAILGITVIIGLAYVTDDDRVTGAKRRAASSERPSIRGADSSTKDVANSVVDTGTAAIGRKVDEAAEQFNEPVDNSAEKAAKSPRRGAQI